MSKVHEPYYPEKPTLGKPPVSENTRIRKSIKELENRVKKLEEGRGG
jgi:hypothetical protein